MYSLSTTKKMIVTAALIASFSIAAQSPEIVEQVDALAVTNSEVESSEVESSEVESSELTQTEIKNTGVKTQTCPDHFYQVKLPNDGKLCQVFAADLPASMIFYVPQLPEAVIAFYKQNTTTFNTTRHVKDRVLLQSEDKNTTLIISSDGKGTQVDVLVKSSNS